MTMRFPVANERSSCYTPHVCWYGWVCGLVLLCGCNGETLGPCDEAAAKRVVYDERGYPYYAGQALVHASCGQAAFCHSAAAEGRARWGAPHGLDFDMDISSVSETTVPLTPPEARLRERLRNGRRNVLQWGESFYDSVESGWMPPYGRATLDAHAGISRYWFADDDSRLPRVDDAEGLVILRNWLACGAPVVERTSPHPDGVEPVGDVQPLGMLR